MSSDTLDREALRARYREERDKRIRPDGNDLTQVTTFGDSTDNSTWNPDLARSPDGSRILLTHGQGKGQIWVMDREGSDGHAVAESQARDRQPTFSSSETVFA